MPTEILEQLKTLRAGVAEALKKDPRYLTLMALDKSIAEIGGVLASAGLVSAEAAKAPRLAARFDQLDQDKDGRLSADERPHRGMHHRGGKRGAHARMQRADTDRDGRISRAEAQAAQAKHAGRFDELDVNKDGYLDRADRQARMAQRRGECFAKADTDKNGQLSRAEFENAHCGGGVAGRMPRNNPNPGPLPPKK